MKICTAAQIREWDQYTIQHEPVASIDLMERAAAKCYEWIIKKCSSNNFNIICGNGNNGGDGLAIARMLAKEYFTVNVFIYHAAKNSTADFETNLTRLAEQAAVKIHWIKAANDLPIFDKESILIEALFGSGLSRPPDVIATELIEHINNSGCEIISIDIPGGMYAGVSSKGNAIIRANHTLSFQCYKPAFLFSENAAFAGEIHVLDIELHKDYYNALQARYILSDKELILSIYKPRNNFAHKGNLGHALLLAGSYGKMGAAVLSAKSCLRSGVGLLTCCIPGCGYSTMQISVPEAMVITGGDENVLVETAIDLNKYNTIGIGPGIGTDDKTIAFLHSIFTAYNKPVVVDADGLNCMAVDKSLFEEIPAGSILTPHPKEFDRLFGESFDDFERTEKALINAAKYSVMIVLKGHHTFIALPGGYGYFNSTGNAGMATAGSGDVLTGIITGLLAQGYSSAHAAVFGVYLHGLAGDIAAEKLSQEAMIAGDIVENLGTAFKQLV